MSTAHAYLNLPLAFGYASTRMEETKSHLASWDFAPVNAPHHADIKLIKGIEDYEKEEKAKVNGVPSAAKESSPPNGSVPAVVSVSGTGSQAISVVVGAGASQVRLEGLNIADALEVVKLAYSLARE